MYNHKHIAWQNFNADSMPKNTFDMLIYYDREKVNIVYEPLDDPPIIIDRWGMYQTGINEDGEELYNWTTREINVDSIIKFCPLADLQIQ